VSSVTTPSNVRAYDALMQSTHEQRLRVIDHVAEYLSDVSSNESMPVARSSARALQRVLWSASARARQLPQALEDCVHVLAAWQTRDTADDVTRVLLDAAGTDIGALCDDDWLAQLSDLIAQF
jgi:hypothetical protein